MTHDPSPLPFPATDDPDERHAASPTAHLLDELALYGYRPGQDEPDPGHCPSPTPPAATSTPPSRRSTAMLTGTRLEDDLADLLWSFVNLFHRKIDRIEAELDRNETAQRRGQAEQDGSEVKSIELERLTGEGQSLIERRNAFEFFRDHTAELFEAATGSAWRPRTGSMVNRRALTAALIDSRDFIAARRRADTQTLAPSGPRIAFTGGADCNDHTAHLGGARQSAFEAPRHGAAARRLTKRRRAHRRLLGRQSQSSTGGLQTRLDPAPERRTLQAQRPDARSPADRRHRVSRFRYRRQPRRQGEKPRDSRVAL